MEEQKLQEEQGTVIILDEIFQSDEMKAFSKELMENKGNEIFRYAGKIADMLFEKTGVNQSFPVDIREIVRRCKISVFETNLNADIGFEIERINGYLRKREEQWCIFLEARDSELIKRYVLAHELSHYLIDKTGEVNGFSDEQKERHCVDPLFSKKWHEVMSDILASFFVFPPKALIEYLEQYTREMQEKNVYPIDSYNWLRALGQKAQISTYFTIMSYQYLKIYMCDLYNDNQDSDIIKKNKRFFK